MASSLVICFLICSLVINSFPASSASGLIEGLLATPTSTVEGELRIFWGDQSREDGGASLVVYQLVEAATARVFALDFSGKLPLPYNELAQLRGQQVKVTGWSKYHLQGAQGEDEFQVATLAPIDKSLRIQSGATPMVVSGGKPFLSIMCKFPDVSGEPRNLSYFQEMYSAAYPGLDHFWQEMSMGVVNITGSGAYGWYTLPSPRLTYIANNRLDFLKIATDCTAQADADVDFRTIYGINLMFNGNLDGYAWGGGMYMTLDGLSRFWPMTWEPPWGYQHVTAIAHEMGHAFGLPHSSGMYGQTYDNRWDVMSDTWTDCVNLVDPVYGCLPQGTIGYHLDRLGWIPVGRSVSLTPGTGGTYSLVQLDQSPADGLRLLTVNLPGTSTRYFTVEVRQKQGYDAKLPREGVIIHEIVTTRDRPAQVFDTDLNGNTGDEGALWSVYETFTDNLSGVSIRVMSGSAGQYTIRVTYGSPVLPTATYTPTPAITPTLMVIYSHKNMLPAVIKP